MKELSVLVRILDGFAFIMLQRDVLVASIAQDKDLNTLRCDKGISPILDKPSSPYLRFRPLQHSFRLDKLRDTLESRASGLARFQVSPTLVFLNGPHVPLSPVPCPF